MESNKHPNARNSVYFGIAEIVIFVLMFSLSFYYKAFPDLLLQIFAFIITIVSAIINIKNTFETNDNWKTAFGIIAILFTVSLYAYTVSLHNLH